MRIREDDKGQRLAPSIALYEGRSGNGCRFLGSRSAGFKFVICESVGRQAGRQAASKVLMGRDGPCCTGEGLLSSMRFEDRALLRDHS